MDLRNKELVELDWLLLRARRGNAEAIERLVRRFERSLFYYIRRLAGNDSDAWDALQRTWIRVLAGIGGVRDAGALKTWMYRVARHTTLNQIRGHQRYRKVLREKADEPSPDVEPALFTAENAEEVHRALEKLELPYREALTLFFLEDLSVREIADVIEIPEGTVKWRLHEARKKLREILEQKHV